MLAVALMYIKGVSTRDAEAAMKEFGIESLSSTQVGRAAKLLDDELEAWRARNAIHHAPNQTIRKCIGAKPRGVWNAPDMEAATGELARLVEAYRETARKLSEWLEDNVPEGLAIFSPPERHGRRTRTSNPMERAVQQELKRRTVKVRVFPNEQSLERLLGAVLVKIDDKWQTANKAYIIWDNQND